MIVVQRLKLFGKAHAQTHPTSRHRSRLRSRPHPKTCQAPHGPLNREYPYEYWLFIFSKHGIVTSSKSLQFNQGHHKAQGIRTRQAFFACCTANAPTNQKQRAEDCHKSAPNSFERNTLALKVPGGRGGAHTDAPDPPGLSRGQPYPYTPTAWRSCSTTTFGSSPFSSSAITSSAL